MTLVVGLKGRDGVIIAADSRGIIGDPRGLTAINDKYEKIFQITKFAAVASFGAAELSSQMMDIICKHDSIIKLSNEMDIELIADTFRKSSQKIYMDWFKQTPPQDRPTIGYIVGGIDKKGEARLYTLISNFEFAPQYHTKGTAMGGIPQYATYLSHKLYEQEMICDQLERIAIFLISETATQDPKVGGPIKLARITSEEGFILKMEEEIVKIHENNKKINKVLKEFFNRGG